MGLRDSIRMASPPTFEQTRKPRLPAARTTVDTSEDTAGNSAGTGGGAGQTGVNGSSVALPFGLDPATTPVMGSYGQPSPGTLTSDWYQLPDVGENATRGDIISIAAAGRVRSVDKGRNRHPTARTSRSSTAQRVASTDAETDAVETLGKIAPLDIGPGAVMAEPACAVWIRFPSKPTAFDWSSATTTASPTNGWPSPPPRVPKTQKLNDVVGSQAPVQCWIGLSDWHSHANAPSIIGSVSPRSPSIGSFPTIPARS